MMDNCETNPRTDSFLKQLTDSQKQAVCHVDGPLLIIAGPGSGKTRVITYRIAELIRAGVRPWNICAITFTNKAADEMRQRALALGASSSVHISTFHSLCVRILRQYSDSAQLESNFSIYDSKEQARCVRLAIKECNLDTSNFAPARMHSAISTLKNNMEDVDSYEDQAVGFFPKSLAKIYRRYQTILRENNALDFDDLLMRTALMLRNDKQVRDQLSERFKYLLVDEYQDTNSAQYEIAKYIALSHGNICVTGDPDQSIYRWRGADIRNILIFEKDWPQAKVIKLQENFRSTPDILKIADKLIANNSKRKAKLLIPTRDAGEDVSVDAYDDETAEAMGVAEKINQLVAKGSQLRDIAIFYRVNSMSRVLEEAFIQNQLPYQIVRGVEFYGRKEIRDMLGYLKILVNPSDEVSLMRVINTPTRGIGKTTIGRVADYARVNHITLYQALTKVSQIAAISNGPKAKISVFINMIEKFKASINKKVAELMEIVFEESGLKKSLLSVVDSDKEALDNVDELISSAAKFDEQAQQPLLIDFLQQISLFSDADAYDASDNRVALMTLHAAKGLEFKNAFIIGLEDGILPHERSTNGDEEELEEERRLFFVGITRAKDNLNISYAKYRTIRGQMLRSIPSQFLYELGIDFAESTTAFEPEASYSSGHSYDYSEFAKVEKVSKSKYAYVKNQLVRHKKFGLGRVESFKDMGENSVVTVRFNNGQVKSLLLKYANLTGP